MGGVFKGHEGVREWSRQVDEVFEEVHFEPDQIEDLPDERVLAVGRARFRGRGSGVGVIAGPWGTTEDSKS